MVGAAAGMQHGVLVLAAVVGALVLTALLLSPPWAALGVLLVPLVLFEANPQSSFLSFTARFYHGHRLTPPDVLFWIFVFATLCELVRRGERPRLPGPLTYPLLFLIGCDLMAIVNGHYSGGVRGDMLSQLESVFYLAAMPSS